MLIAVMLSWSSCSAQKPITESNPIYGSRCGEGAQVPKERTQMNLHVQRRDTTELSQWLWSKDTALMCYGVEGLRKLQSSGTSLNATQQARLAKLESSNYAVATCKGCFFELLPMNEVLADPLLRDQ